MSQRLLRWAAGAALLAGLLALAGWVALPLVPLPRGLFSPEASQLEFVDRHGHPLRAVPPPKEPFGQRVEYAAIPQALVQATLAAEDRRFWQHSGVDWQAYTRAAWQFVRHRHVVSGASTITQQLVKLAQPRPRTLRTKIIEALQALRLEQLWDKQHILCEYLNRLDYGCWNRGCAAAARFYFAKPLGDLSTAECAFLAGLPQAPTRLNPVSHFDRARKRQQWVLVAMRQVGWLTDGDLNRFAQEPLHLVKAGRMFEAPHFVDLVLEQPALEKEDASEQTDSATSRRWRLHGLVRTTLDLELNRLVQRRLRQHLAGLRAQQVSNGAVVVLDNRTGEVLALVGSEDYSSPAAGQVNGAWAPRSAGSTFKPFTYLLAFERGASPATVVADVPTEFATASGLFAPVNYNRRCYGPVAYRLALANSLNIPAVKVLASVGGPEPLLEKLQACGLTTLNRAAESYGLGLTIGNAEARLLELANAYACLARLGEYLPWRLLAQSSVQVAPNRRRRVADAGAAYLIADILSDNAARVLAFGAESPLRFDFPVACKTGTSSGFRDNWAFGYTPEFTVGVWVGNFNGAPMHSVSGVTGAAPILHEVFEHLHQRWGTGWYAKPADVVEATIHPITGKRLVLNGHKQIGVTESFLASAPPPIESAEDYDSSGRVRLGPEYREWLTSADNCLAGQVVLTKDQRTLAIKFPLPGTKVFLDPDLPGQGSRIHPRADGPEGLRWQSETLKYDQGQNTLLLVRGRHWITVSDPRSGATATTWIEVLAR